MPVNREKFPPAFKAAYALSAGKYCTPHTARINPDKAMLIDQGQYGITNATSSVPIIGTDGLGPCIGLVIYNKKTKTAVVSHDTSTTGKDYRKLLQKVRANNSDALEIHIIGGSFVKHLGFLNDDSLHYLNGLAEAVAATPNATLKTFDVFDRPKPIGFAIDTRNGGLIRSSGLFKYDDDIGDHLNDTDAPHSLFTGWNKLDDENFDGTVPGHQQLRKGRHS